METAPTSKSRDGEAQTHQKRKHKVRAAGKHRCSALTAHCARCTFRREAQSEACTHLGVNNLCAPAKTPTGQQCVDDPWRRTGPQHPHSLRNSPSGSLTAGTLRAQARPATPRKPNCVIKLRAPVLAVKHKTPVGQQGQHITDITLRRRVRPGQSKEGGTHQNNTVARHETTNPASGSWSSSFPRQRCLSGHPCTGSTQSTPEQTLVCHNLTPGIDPHQAVRPRQAARRAH